MANLIEELISVLEETTGCYEKLLVMANNKKDVIIKGDVPSLQTITDEEQIVAGRLLRLEKKRIGIIDDIALVTNQDKQKMTVSVLIQMLAKQEETQNQLKAVSHRMMDLVESVKQVNDTNKVLLEESIEYINFTMNAIKSAGDQPVGSNYQNKGNLYEGKGSVNFFDAKQ